MTTNLTIILACLSMIESGDNDLKVGRRGEVSRYQIMPKVWPKYCLLGQNMPPRRAKVTTVADTVATRILEERIGRFKKQREKDPTPFEIYVLWNAPAQISHPSKVVSEKAQRFENLVKEKMKGEKK